MTPEQLELVRQSFDRLGASSDDLAPEFYRQLFAAEPDLRRLFTAEWPTQEAKFTKQLSAIVATLDDLDDLVEETRALGARHSAYGVRVAHYPAVRTALLGALAAMLGEQFDAATRQAWELAFNLVAECMMAGATGR